MRIAPAPPVPAVHRDELLGSEHGDVQWIRGPRASRMYTEWFQRSQEAPGTLLFTHGWCVNEAIWHHQKAAPRLAPWNMVTWDLPGHGHSTPVSRSHLTLDLSVDSLARVIDATEGNLVLVGHSLGGVLTLGYLTRHPQTAKRRVKGIVLVATPLLHFARRVAGKWPGSALRARMLTLGTQLMVENSIVDRWFSAEAGSDDARCMSYRLIRTGFGKACRPDHVRFVRDIVATVPPSVRADTFRAMTGFDLRPVLPDVKTPAMVVIGGRDRLVTGAEGHAVQRRLPRGRLITLQDAGHALFLESHEAFNEELARFARRRLGAGDRAKSIPRAAPGLEAHALSPSAEAR
jgi:pimeloyl-ACP methyl ester carboxylesterase